MGRGRAAGSAVACASTAILMMKMCLPRRTKVVSRLVLALVVVWRLLLLLLLVLLVLLLLLLHVIRLRRVARNKVRWQRARGWRARAHRHRTALHLLHRYLHGRRRPSHLHVLHVHGRLLLVERVVLLLLPSVKLLLLLLLMLLLLVRWHCPRWHRTRWHCLRIHLLLRHHGWARRRPTVKSTGRMPRNTSAVHNSTTSAAAAAAAATRVHATQYRTPHPTPTTTPTATATSTTSTSKRNISRGRHFWPGLGRWRKLALLSRRRARPRSRGRAGALAALGARAAARLVSGRGCCRARATPARAVSRGGSGGLVVLGGDDERSVRPRRNELAVIDHVEDLPSLLVPFQEGRDLGVAVLSLVLGEGLLAVAEGVSCVVCACQRVARSYDGSWGAEVAAGGS